MRYLQRDIERNQIEFDFELDSENYTIGRTWLDYMNGHWIPMSDAQIAFADEHPIASAKEIFDMKLTVIEIEEPTVEQQNTIIRKDREMAYRLESDSLYMAFAKYSELGELEKANAAKSEWLAKVQEIDIRFPYIITINKNERNYGEIKPIENRTV